MEKITDTGVGFTNAVTLKKATNRRAQLEMNHACNLFLQKLGLALSWSDLEHAEARAAMGRKKK